MILAVKTTASPAELWAIVVVAVFAVGFWLYMVEVFATRRGPRRRDKGTTRELDSPLAGAARAATERVLEAFQDRRLRSEPGRRASSEPGEVSDQRDQDRAIPWAVPEQRQSPTDQPAAADPGRGRPGGGPPKQD